MVKEAEIGMKATKAQLDFIEQIEEFVSEQFKGSTKEDASFYIQRNIEEYKLRSSSNWTITNGYD
jgi:hypothetical protein